MHFKIEQLTAHILILTLIGVCAKSLDRLPPPNEAQSKLLVHQLPSSSVVGDQSKLQKTKPNLNYTETEANQINAPSDTDKITEYVKAFATVR